MVYALIKNGKVENTIDANQVFAQKIIDSGRFDSVIRIDNLPDGFGVGDFYADGEFSKPPVVTEREDSPEKNQLKQAYNLIDAMENLNDAKFILKKIADLLLVNSI